MLLCSVITKCNDIQQADKLFADKRETALQSSGGCVLMLVSVYRVSNTQRPKNQIPAQHRIGVVRLTRWSQRRIFSAQLARIYIFQVSITQSEHLLRVKIKFWHVLLWLCSDMCIEYSTIVLTKISKCIKKNKPWTRSFDTGHEQ